MYCTCKLSIYTSCKILKSCNYKIWTSDTYFNNGKMWYVTILSFSVFLSDVKENLHKKHTAIAMCSFFSQFVPGVITWMKHMHSTFWSHLPVRFLQRCSFKANFRSEHQLTPSVNHYKKCLKRGFLVLFEVILKCTVQWNQIYKKVVKCYI